MNKYLYIESYALGDDDKILKEHRESDVFPVERITYFGINYDTDGYSLTVVVNDDSYEYWFSDKFTNKHKDEIVNKYIDFLEDAERLTGYIDLTRYQG